MSTTGDHSAPPSGLRSGRPYIGARTSGVAWRLAPASLLLVLLGLAAAWADERPAEKSKPLTPEQATDAVLAAVKAKDEAALKALAEKDEPDPWLVAEELCRGRHRMAATAFAAAAPRVAMEGLAEYVADWASRPDAKDAYERADAAFVAGRPAEALEILDGADPDRSVYGVRQVHLRAVIMFQTGEVSASVPVWSEASNRAQAIGWTARAAITALVAADAAAKLRRFAVVTPLAERAGLSFKALGNADFCAHAHVLLGTAHLAFGSNAAAIRALEQVLELGERVTDPQLRQLAYFTLGAAYSNSGGYETALRYFRMADAVIQAGQRWPDAVNVGRQMASALRFLGREQEAAEQLARTLALSREHRLIGEEAMVLLDLGSLWRTSRPTKAREHLELARATFEKTRQWNELARTHASLATAAYELGQREEALHQADSALAVAEKTKEPRLIHEVVTAHAELSLKLGRLEQATALGQRALALAEAEGVPWQLVETHRLLGSIHLAAGELDAAFASWRRMADIHRTEFLGLAEEHAAKGAEMYAALWGEPVAAASLHHRPAEAFHLLESARAGALLEALGGPERPGDAQIPEALRAQEDEARREVVKARATFDRARDTGLLLEVRRAREALEEAQDARLAAVERIQREAKAAASVAYPTVVSLEQAQDGLREGEALVTYGLFGGRATGLVVEPKEARVVSLGDARVIADKAMQLFAVGQPEGPGVQRASSAEASAALRELVVKPLNLGKHVRRVLISPMGELSYVPLSLLFPDREAAYVPSATTYSLLVGDYEKRGRKVLALGDPDYQTEVDEAALRIREGDATRLPQLPATREEARTVADVPILGKQATVSGLRAALEKEKRWRAVHFACHGLVDPERPMLSALALTADTENDGFLSALEVFRMKIPADLVVMSACETGKGRIYKTEGIVGLTRAFMFAGAPRVICSLWKVDDEATRALMIKLYELWNPKGGKGLGAAAALKRAQAFVRGHEKWKHPRYWAAWVLWGLPE